ncbi:MAG: P-loop NTPase fold protein, partial [Cyclobacteriaceae bacterium]
MENRLKINYEIDAPLKSFDVAITSIDSNGSTGELNQFVLKSLGYNPDQLPEKEILESGFAWMHFSNLKPVLFIVTIGKGNKTGDNLRRNLSNALNQYSERLAGLKVWVPLMGIGAGRLNPIDSFTITFETITSFNSLSKAPQFTFSLLGTLGKKNHDHISKKVDSWNSKYDDSDENEVKKPNEKVLETEQKEIPNPLHDECFLQLRSYHEKNPAFVFWLRQKNTNNRLNEGFWFQGTESYAFVGLYNAPSGNYSTKSVGLVFWPSDDEGNIGLTFEVLYKGEKNEKRLKFYRWVRELMENEFGEGKGFEDHGPVRFKVHLASKEPFGAAFQFLDRYREQMDAQIKELGLDKMFIGQKEFERKLSVTVKRRAAVLGKKTDDFQDAVIDTEETKEEKEIEQELSGEGGNQKTASAPINNLLTRASFDHDGAYSGKDLLDIENDVRSFALLLASKNVSPPLAIALFGKWGSGKSFFMKHLQHRVNELSERQGFLVKPSEPLGKESNIEEELFCKGIAQIEFNAWSYLDANLWAGLVSSIFEKLNEYLTESTKSTVAKMKVQEKLKEKLSSFQTEILSIEQRREHLEKLKVGYSIEQNKLTESIKDNFKNFIANELKLGEGTVNLYDRISQDGHLATLSQKLQIDDLQKEAGIFTSFFRNIRQLKHLKKYIITVIVGLGIAAVSYWAIDFIQVTLAGLLPVIGALGVDLKQISKRYNQVKAFVQKYNEAISSNSELEKKIVEYQQSIEATEEQIASASDEIKDIDKKIKDFETYVKEEIHQEAIKHFIHSRANHKDYKDKLGIVSIIRKDFETLSELFYENGNAETQDENIRKDKQEIRNQFKEGKRLERIILYIDDLDRCADNKVLEVIQAVHLLMAFPLFNVVVGVDKKCIRNALLLK